MIDLFWHFLADNSGWIVAIITLCIVIKQDRGATRTDHDATIRASQKTADSLANLARQVAEMQTTLAAMADRESTYGRRVTQATARIDDHERRITRIEDRCDLHMTDN